MSFNFSSWSRAASREEAAREGINGYISGERAIQHDREWNEMNRMKQYKLDIDFRIAKYEEKYDRKIRILDEKIEELQELIEDTKKIRDDVVEIIRNSGQ